jgi:hypothetical protein
VIRLDLKTNLKRYAREAEKAPDIIRAAIVRGMNIGANLVVKQAKLNLTSADSVNFGILRASIGQKTDPAELVSRIGPGLAQKATAPGGESPKSYGFYVEFGRKGGRPPPPEVIELWVRRKLGLSEDEAEDAAFLIAQAIGRKGVAPAPFLIPAARTQTPAIVKAIDTQIAAAAVEINGAQP